jgi:hypothetical protein
MYKALPTSVFPYAQGCCPLVSLCGVPIAAQGLDRNMLVKRVQRKLGSLFLENHTKLSFLLSLARHISVLGFNSPGGKDICVQCLRFCQWAVDGPSFALWLPRQLRACLRAALAAPS